MADRRGKIAVTVELASEDLDRIRAEIGGPELKNAPLLRSFIEKHLAHVGAPATSSSTTAATDSETDSRLLELARLVRDGQRSHELEFSKLGQHLADLTRRFDALDKAVPRARELFARAVDPTR